MTKEPPRINQHVLCLGTSALEMAQIPTYYTLIGSGPAQFYTLQVHQLFICLKGQMPQILSVHVNA